VERTLIKNATIISVDPQIGELRPGDILIEGSKIAAIAPSIPASDAEIIDGSDQIAIPGFVDTHRHTWESLLRGTGADWTLAQYFTAVRKVMGGLYKPEDNYVGNNLGALDALDAGITTLYD
jgi:5-methylthioadenosine/S-adenosylhomocysteine deaminase